MTQPETCMVALTASADEDLVSYGTSPTQIVSYYDAGVWIILPTACTIHLAVLGRASDRQMLMIYILEVHASKTCLRDTHNFVLLAYLARSHSETHLREGSSDASFARGVSTMTDSK